MKVLTLHPAVAWLIDILVSGAIGVAIYVFLPPRKNLVLSAIALSVSYILLGRLKRRWVRTSERH
jgi:hypothetical protein